MKKDLPYDFDLYFDLKTKGEVKRYIKYLKEQIKQIPEDLQFLLALVEKHNIKL